MIGSGWVSSGVGRGKFWGCEGEALGLAGGFWGWMKLWVSDGEALGLGGRSLTDLHTSYTIVTR